jgi:hypothetical protein
LAGKYSIGVIVSIVNDIQNFTQSFEDLWKLDLQEGEQPLVKFQNYPPRFIKDIPTLVTLEVGQSYFFDTGVPSDDTVSVEVETSTPLIQY